MIFRTVLELQIHEDNSDNKVIIFVIFNDAGDWVVITTNHYTASDSRITEWLKEGARTYGMVWAVRLTDNAMVVVYSDGYKFLGEVPYSLEEALRETELDVYRLEIAGDAGFFSDKDDNYQYNM